MKIMIFGKTGVEKISTTGELPEINTLIADACMVPIIKAKGSRRYTSEYKAPPHVKNEAYSAWLKRLVYEKPTYNMDVNFTGIYKPMPWIDNKVNSALYFDGTYVNKDIEKDCDVVFSVFYNTGHKNRIKNSAKMFGIKIDEWFNIDYGQYINTNHRYVHGSKWLAACIGASFAHNVIVPSTNDFWSTERGKYIFTEGSDWVSRYYGEVVQFYNPVKKSKVDILEETDSDWDNLIPCRCGRCMECATTYAVLGKKLPKSFFKNDPRRDEENAKKLRTAVEIGIADIYRPFVKE